LTHRLFRPKLFGMQDGIPETLQEAISYFADDQRAHEFAVKLRWPDRVACAHCESKKGHVFISTRKVWRCADCKKQFSVRLGTVMEDSPLSLSKWMTAMWLLANCKNGISSYELARDLGITQKSAWHLLHRVRAAMKAGTLNRKLAGIVEADETYIGGQLKNMHKSKRKAKGLEKPIGKRSAGPFVGKAIVSAVLERDGEVRAQVIDNLDADIRRQFVKNNVERGSKFMTDMMNTRFTEFVHQFIDHAQEYVRGEVHTQGIENFWSLLKRGLKGTYVSVEPFHLSRYVDEQAFRFNTRKDDDAGRFEKTFSQISGRRLTWAELTRKPSVN
jgi:transposase-like protein